MTFYHHNLLNSKTNHIYMKGNDDSMHWQLWSDRRNWSNIGLAFELLFDVSVHTAHDKQVYLCSFSKIKTLTFFILIWAPRAVAVARFQSVVSSGPPERRTWHLILLTVDMEPPCQKQCHSKVFNTYRSSHSLTSLFSSVSWRLSWPATTVLLLEVVPNHKTNQTLHRIHISI